MEKLKLEELTPLEYYEGLKRKDTNILGHFNKELISIVKEVASMYSVYQESNLDKIVEKTYNSILKKFEKTDFKFNHIHPLSTVKQEFISVIEYHEKLKRKDKNILEDFIKRLFPIVRELGRKYNISQKNEIEELTEETYVRVWENLHFGNFKFQGLHPSAYARKTAGYVILEHLRRIKKIEIVETLPDVVMPTDKEYQEQEAKAEKAKLLNYAISTLKEDCQTILDLTYWGRLTSEEVANNDELPKINKEGSVRNKLVQCREKLRQKLIALNYFKL